MEDAKVANPKRYVFALGVALLIAWFFAAGGGA